MDSLMEKDVQPLNVWYSITRKVRTRKCGSFYFTGNYDLETGLLVQTHFHTSKGAPQCATCWGEALSRLISKGLKDGSSKISIVRELRNLRCGKQNGLMRPGDALSCPDGIAKALDSLPKKMKIEEKGDRDGVTDTKQETV